MSNQGDQTEAELERTREMIRETAPAQAEENEAAAAEINADPADGEPGWDGYTVAELQDELRHRDLPVSGTKDELVARLDQDDRGA